MTLEVSPKPRERRLRGKRCAQCDGRGWKKAADRDWADPCSKCNGRGCFRSTYFAWLLGVHRRDVYRVETMQAGTRVAVRVLDAIAKAFPEALA